MEIPIITVDGPGGAGKGTISLRLAKKLAWHFLDSGAIYRTFALAVKKNHIALDNHQALEALARSLNIHFDTEVWLEDEMVTQDIRGEDIGNLASTLAAYPFVRKALLEFQRDFCRLPGLVADGRDMGTVVFPEAKLKIYLEATSLERAKRRYLQLKDNVQNVTLQSLLAEITLRDERDKQRSVAPLRPAKEAVVIDTTNMGIEEVFNRVMELVEQSSIEY